MQEHELVQTLIWQDWCWCKSQNVVIICRHEFCSSLRWASMRWDSDKTSSKLVVISDEEEWCAHSGSQVKSSSKACHHFFAHKAVDEFAMMSGSVVSQCG
jgi:hypothetical protein